jgi:hypothetical protein
MQFGAGPDRLQIYRRRWIIRRVLECCTFSPVCGHLNKRWPMREQSGQSPDWIKDSAQRGVRHER